METKDFNSHVDLCIDRTRNVLQKKAQEYAPNTDRLQNFKDGATILRCSSERYLLGLVTKHYLALIDFVDQLEKGNDYHENMWTEKTGDIINYMIILEAIIYERQKNK